MCVSRAGLCMSPKKAVITTGKGLPDGTPMHTTQCTPYSPEIFQTAPSSLGPHVCPLCSRESLWPSGFAFGGSFLPVTLYKNPTLGEACAHGPVGPSSLQHPASVGGRAQNVKRPRPTGSWTLGYQELGVP